MNIKKISFVVALIGIFLMLIVVNNVSLIIISIEEIDNYTGEYIGIYAEVISVGDWEGTPTLLVGDETGSKTVYLDYSSYFEEGDFILLEGVVEEYNGNKKLNVKKIKISD